MGFFFLCVIDGVEDEMAGDPLRGINVDAAGGAGKVLKMIAEKVCLFFFFFCQMDIAADIFWGGGEKNKSEQSPTPTLTPSSKVEDEKVEGKKEGVVAKRKIEQMACELALGLSIRRNVFGDDRN